jgi:hypothetical protein
VKDGVFAGKGSFQFSAQVAISVLITLSSISDDRKLFFEVATCRISLLGSERFRQRASNSSKDGLVSPISPFPTHWNPSMRRSHSTESHPQDGSFFDASIHRAVSHPFIRQSLDQPQNLQTILSSTDILLGLEWQSRQQS